MQVIMPSAFLKTHPEHLGFFTNDMILGSKFIYMYLNFPCLCQRLYAMQFTNDASDKWRSASGCCIITCVRENDVKMSIT